MYLIASSVFHTHTDLDPRESIHPDGQFGEESEFSLLNVYFILLTSIVLQFILIKLYNARRNGSIN